MATHQQPSIFSLLSEPTNLKSLAQIHALSIKTELHTHPLFLRKFLSSFTHEPITCQHVSYARQFFNQVQHPDVFAFNTLSRLYSRSDDPLNSFEIFVLMLQNGIQPDNYTFPCLLKACAYAKALEEGKQAHCVCVKLGFSNNEFVEPTLVNFYAECGEISAARSVFDRSGHADVISYNSIITACVRNNRPSEALSLFREMQEKKIKPTHVTILNVLNSCALIGTLELGKWVHEFAKKNKFDALIKINTALIDMYAKCGSLKDAIKLFDEMLEKDTPAWSAMIISYALHGQSEKAISLFESMKREGIKPDSITFLGVLHACSHNGKVEQGLYYFNKMKDYGIIPSIKHYGCITDLLARSGQLERAYKYINEVPILPSVILWRTLLFSCGVYQNFDLGKRVFERILELDRSHGSDYVIFSNLCAKKGKLKEMNYVRRLMVENNVVKIPGCSSIEVNNTVHEFFSRDGTHKKSKLVRKLVDELVRDLKRVGYVPDISRVSHVEMEENEKEISLRYHSEKLAVAFGIFNTRKGEEIRVCKNIRICEDCHSFVKLVSKVHGRSILVRDLNRFHCFENGACSCKDFW
ncbi:hypothetical protein LUZ60_006740 [Juncus effusus]|nr:hypothetical protein LUZ60_006740 [Juncus effusus]